MKHSYWLVSRLGWIACLLAGALFTGGCSKEAEEEVAATPDPAPTEEAAPAAEAPAEESTTEAALVPMNVDETLRGSDQAVAAKDWGTATDSLLKLQLSGSIQNDKQSWDYNRRMTVLQDQLMQAADAGDPKAQAAIELLKKSRRVR
jgi:hypothetical protein